MLRPGWIGQIQIQRERVRVSPGQSGTGHGLAAVVADGVLTWCYQLSSLVESLQSSSAPWRLLVNAHVAHGTNHTQAPLRIKGFLIPDAQIWACARPVSSSSTLDWLVSASLGT
jgi:hypothetical protein